MADDEIVSDATPGSSRIHARGPHRTERESYARGRAEITDGSYDSVAWWGPCGPAGLRLDDAGLQEALDDADLAGGHGISDVPGGGVVVHQGPSEL
jgi:hypothetical protein